MMKLISLRIFLFFAAQAFVINSYPAPTLKGEIDQFSDVINFQRISEITREYWENDPSLQALTDYLHNDKFKFAWNILIKSHTVDDVLEWILAHGVDVNLLIENISEDGISIHQSSFMPEPVLFKQFSLMTFEDEVRNEINFDEMNALIDDLISDGNDFAHLYLILKVSKPALEHIFMRDEIQDVMQDLRGLGLNVDYLKVILYNLLRWN